MDKEAKFTPGPWRFVRSEEFDGDSWRICGTTPRGLEGCYYVAEVMDGNGLPQNVCNVHLIAASPDMYEASSDALSLLRRIIEGKEWGAIEEYADKLDAALKKARGEQ